MTDKSKDTIIYLVAMVISILAFFFIKKPPEPFAGIVTPYVLFLTLVAILIYSYETRGLKKQMVLQNELNLRPRLVFIATGGVHIWVKNIGNGPALDILIKGYTLEFSGGEKVQYVFRCQNILSADEACELTVNIESGDHIRNASQPELAQLEPITAEHTMQIKLSYKNAVGQKYDNDSSLLGKGMLQKMSVRV